jgi:hypothetical protein
MACVHSAPPEISDYSTNQVIFLCVFTAQPLALADLSRRVIRRHLRKRRLSAVYQLPLPTVLKQYLVWK